MIILKQTKYYQNLRTAKVKIFRFLNSIKGRIIIGTNYNSIINGWEKAGLSVHRYYVESFLQEFSIYIKGHCLEFQENTYSTRFGKDKITKIDIMHKEFGNSNATIVADLCKENKVPSNLFDCIICTYTLHLVYNFEKFVSELHRILKKSGNLFIAVPQIMTYYPKYHEYWRFTEQGLYTLLSHYFNENEITMRSYGNSLTAAGELRGLTKIDFFKSEINKHDNRFAMVICAMAMKTS